MNASTRHHLENAGYTVGDVRDFLELSPEEEALVDTGLALSNLLRVAREARGLTPDELARKANLASDEIARLESAPGTRFEDVFHLLCLLGVPPREIAAAISKVELREAVAA